MARFRKANQQLKRWQAQSLPSDPEIARSLYQAWLVGLVGRPGFISPNVDSSEPVTRKGLYSSLRFSARGRGTPEQLTRFLFDFYRADHLHHIESLNLTPVPRSDELDIALSIEALSLPDGERKDQLSTRVSDRLASDELTDYRAIVERNLFGIGGGGLRRRGLRLFDRDHRSQRRARGLVHAARLGRTAQAAQWPAVSNWRAGRATSSRSPNRTWSWIAKTSAGWSAWAKA